MLPTTVSSPHSVPVETKTEYLRRYAATRGMTYDELMNEFKDASYAHLLAHLAYFALSLPPSARELRRELASELSIALRP